MVPPPLEQHESNFQARGKPKKKKSPQSETRWMRAIVRALEFCLVIFSSSNSVLSRFICDLEKEPNKRWSKCYATNAQCSHCSLPGLKSGCIWLTSSFSPGENKQADPKLPDKNQAQRSGLLPSFIAKGGGFLSRLGQWKAVPSLHFNKAKDCKKLEMKKAKNV